MAMNNRIDVVIAERIFDRTLISPKEAQADAEEVWQKQPGCFVFNKGYRAHRGAAGEFVFDGWVLPEYSASIEAAWLVVEELRRRGIRICSMCDLGAFWHCHFSDGKASWVAAQDTPALAICYAAMRAVGVNLA